MFYRDRSVFLIGAFLALSLSISDASGDTLDEIVVTADFHERSVEDLPASISVLESSTIDKVALTHFEELTHLVPNLNFAGGSNRPRYFQIRGTGERSQYEGAPNPSVGFLIDDIDFSAIGGVALTWDIEQLEVLRGPQGTRYGANALAGLINVRTAGPTDYWNGKARAIVGGDEARGLGAAVGGPVTDALTFRLSGYQYEANGFRDNPFLGRDDTNGRDESEIRAKLRWVPGDQWQIDATAMYVDVDNGYDAFAIDNGLTTYSDRPGRDAQRSLAAALKIDWSGPAGFDIVSISSAAASDIRFGFDADWGNADFWAPFTYDFISERRRVRETISQEIRMLSNRAAGLFGKPLQWALGLYALKLREDLESIDQGILIDPAFGLFSADTRVLSDYEAVNSALFAEADMALTDALSLSAGLRVERRGADYIDSNGLDLNPSENMLGGHLRLSYELSDAAASYAIVSRGYKAGGFNLGQIPAGRREYDAEFMWNVEIGITARLADDRISVRAALFSALRDDQQVSTSQQIIMNDPSSFVFFLDNAATGENRGLEIEATWQVSDTIALYANAGLLDTEIDLDVPDAFLDGRAQAHAPDYTFAAGISWEHPLGWFARVDASGKDAFFFSNSHDERADAYELVNARAGFAGERWQLSVWGRNLTDETYAVRGFFFGNEPPDFSPTRYVRLGDPRQAGVTIEVSF